MSRKLPYKFPRDKLYRLIGSIKHPKQPKTREALVNIKKNYFSAEIFHN